MSASSVNRTSGVMGRHWRCTTVMAGAFVKRWNAWSLMGSTFTCSVPLNRRMSGRSECDTLFGLWRNTVNPIQSSNVSE